MNSYVADTHALFWYLTASVRLGHDAKAAFDEAAAGTAKIVIPSIVVAELYFLNEKIGRPLDFAMEFGRLHQASQFIFVAFESEDVLDFDSDKAVPEMHDRIIAGTARRLQSTCLTLDPAIIRSGIIPTRW
jgi:predicted nucleic acid-binding protein